MNYSSENSSSFSFLAWRSDWRARWSWTGMLWKRNWSKRGNFVRTRRASLPRCLHWSPNVGPKTNSARCSPVSLVSPFLSDLLLSRFWRANSVQSRFGDILDSSSFVLQVSHAFGLHQRIVGDRTSSVSQSHRWKHSDRIPLGAAGRNIEEYARHSCTRRASRSTIERLGEMVVHGVVRLQQCWRSGERQHDGTVDFSVESLSSLVHEHDLLLPLVDDYQRRERTESLATVPRAIDSSDETISSG